MKTFDKKNLAGKSARDKALWMSAVHWHENWSILYMIADTILDARGKELDKVLKMWLCDFGYSNDANQCALCYRYADVECRGCPLFEAVGRCASIPEHCWGKCPYKCASLKRLTLNHVIAAWGMMKTLAELEVED